MLVNGGFESGVDPWQASNGTLDSVSSPVHSGTGAARLIGDGTQVQHEVFQWVEVNPGAPYELTAWVFHNDPNVSSAFLRLTWADENLGQVSTADSTVALTAPDPSYRELSTGPLTAPQEARFARVGLRIQPALSAPFDFTIYADDVSFVGPDPTPTPVPTPVSTFTPTPSSTPSGTASTTPSPSPFASATRSPSPTPRRSPTPVPEQLVFSELTNGGFDALRGDGTPYAWRKFGGEMAVTSAPRFQGSYALRLRSESNSTKWAFQNVHVQGGAFYQATAMALKSDPAVEAAFLRVSWYDSDDASGESLESVDSLIRLENDSKSFRLLDTGPVQAPPEARTARIRLMLRPESSEHAEVFFDSITFVQTSAPTASPQPTVTKPATPTATPASSATAAPTPTPTPVSTETATPQPTPSEPTVFSELTNGGFEEVREDGTPYGWHKFGGEYTATDQAVASGSLSLEISSETGATKWVGQVVTVNSGAYYEAAGLAQMHDPNVEGTFLRVSWYSSSDGSGDAFESADSNVLSENDPGFVFMSTGAVQAPAGAASARVKTMLRPSGDAPARAYFDAISFQAVAAPTPPPVTATPTPSLVPVPAPVAAPVTAEPTVFSSITNGDFEQLRQDGTPYGWRNVGGAMTAGPPASSGANALVIGSTTDSMKWAYQTLTVSPGSYYSASVRAVAVASSADAFLRVSWYHSVDGTGEAVDQVDSEEQVVGTTYSSITTGPILVPSGVHSAKIRLALRPASAAPAVVAFDVVSFSLNPVPVAGSRIGPQVGSAEPEEGTALEPRVLGAVATPVAPVNEREDDEDGPDAIDASSDGGSNYDWIIALAVGIPIGGLLWAGAGSIRNRRNP